MIPKILHYCFGFDRYFGGKPWSLVHFVCLKSAVERIKPDQIYFYYEFEPEGAWWDLTRSLVTLVEIQAPREIFGNALIHPANRADVVRLEKLIDYGGIYLDADVLVHQSFDHLLENSAVLGAEGVNSESLGNGVILSEPNAPFLKRWHEEYRRFQGDKFWTGFPCSVPRKLANSFPDEVTVLPDSAFYRPFCTDEDLKLLFGPSPPSEQRGTLANHLWESKAWTDYLKDLTPGTVRAVDTNFHRWARPFLQDLPDDYGRASQSEGLIRFIQIQQWRLSLRMSRLFEAFQKKTPR